MTGRTSWRRTLSPLSVTCLALVAVTASAQTARVSVTSSGDQAAWWNYAPAISADGRIVVWDSDAANLATGSPAGDTNAVRDVFARDLTTGVTTRVSVGPGGLQANGASLLPAVSGDGRYVVFESTATNLVANDTNNSSDIFVYDRTLAQTTRVSVATGGGQANGNSRKPGISADGRYVAFASQATNLVAGDTNGAFDVFVYDRNTATTTRVSVANDGSQANGASMESSPGVFARPALSADGRYVAFESLATNLVAGDTNGVRDVFVRDTTAGTTTRVSVGVGGAQSNGASFWPAISADGRYVSFESEAINLIPSDGNTFTDVFVHDRSSGITTRVSIGPNGAIANGFSGASAISADGRYVTFASLATNLVSGDTNGVYDIFVHDRLVGQTTRVNVGPASAQATAPPATAPRGESTLPAITGDGRLVVYVSNATNLVAGDTNGADDVFFSVVTSLTVTKAGTGTGTVSSIPGGIACGLTCASFFTFGQVVTLSAVADPNSAFTGWTGACTGTGTCQVTVDQVRNVTATFTSAVRSLTVFQSGAFGFVTTSPAGTTCGSNCYQFPQGTQVTVNAFGCIGVQCVGNTTHFTGWTGDCTGSSCTLLMDTNHSVTANFAYDTYLLTVAKAGTGTGVVSGPGLSCGADCSEPVHGFVTLTAAADAGSVFTGWSGPWCSGSTAPTCGIAVGSPTAMTATFERVPTVTGVSPVSGPTAGGTPITITGTGFSSGAAVTVGGAAATNVVVVNATTITAATPARPAGPATVAVTTAGGTGSKASAFTFLGGPAITAVLPATGPLAGATLVTVTGSSFVGGSTSVAIGGVFASAVTVNSPTELTALSPPASTVGPRVVTVTTPSGSTSLTDGFTYTTAQTLSAEVVGDNGKVATGGTRQPAMSATGRFLVFVDDSDLTADDHNGLADIVVRDRQDGALALITVSYEGGSADGASTRPRISASGRYVAFRSEAANLVPGDTNGAADVFWHDRDVDGNGVFDEAGKTLTLRVSVSDTGQQGDLASGGDDELDLSPDGQWVAFASTARNLVAGDTNGVADVFLHHVASRRTTRVSVKTGGAQGNGRSGSPAVTSGARFVLFSSDASTLVDGDGNGVRDVFVHERATGTTLRLSRTAAGGDANGPSDWPSVDDGGNTFAFQTKATNLLPGLGTSTSWQVVAYSLLFASPLTGTVSAAGRKTNASLIDIAGSTGQVISGQPNTGVAGNGDTTSVEVSGDGTTIGAVSGASDTLPGDTNGHPDGITRTIDETTGTLGPSQNRSRDDAGNQAEAATQSIALDGDGSDVGLETPAPLTETARTMLGTTPGTKPQVYAQGTPLRVDRVSPRTARVDLADRVSIEGAGFAEDVEVRLGGVRQRVVFERSTGVRIDPTPTGGPVGVVELTVTNPVTRETVVVPGGFEFVAAPQPPPPPPPGTTSDPKLPPNPYAASVDTDGDGLPDDYETQFGLDPRSAVGDDGADGDPDADGVTNLQEYAKLTHPRGTVTRFLAEGVVNGVFVTRIALANPGPGTLRILVRVQIEGGGERERAITLDGYRSAKLTLPADIPGMPAAASFSTVVEADGVVVVDRIVWWSGLLGGLNFGFGSHAETAVTSPDVTWYFAEGATHSGFALYYLLQNPSATSPAQVEATYLLSGGGAPVVRQYRLEPASRLTVFANDVPGLGAVDVAAVFRVTNGVPIVAERAMYRDQGGRTWAVGTDGAGVTTPATDWFLAEGATGFFDMFVQVGNPSATPATLTVDYLLESGEVLRKTYGVAGNSRFTVWVNLEAFDGQLKLANAAMSVRVHADVPVIVERSMWWPAPATSWQEAHASFAATQTGTAWGLAEGAVTPAPGNGATYILVANTSPYPAQVRLSLLLPDADPIAKVFTLPATSRLTVPIASAFPEIGGNRQFGALVESLGRSGANCTYLGTMFGVDCSPAQIVVEQAVYNDADGIFWAGGTDQLATRIR